MKQLLIIFVALGILTACNSSKENVSSAPGQFRLVPKDNPTGKSTFSIKLTTDGCDLSPNFTNEFQMTVDSVKNVRIITANNIPEHLVGRFPNAGNPNTIRPQSKKYTIDLTPKQSGKQISAKGGAFGILFSGVEVDPFTNEFFSSHKGINREWNINALTSSLNLGTDCNNAHVQPSGKYHYHGTPNAYLEQLGVDGKKMVKVGYAADGFPIYYKYGYDDQGKLVELTSGYQLKAGNRGGDGVTAPDGVYDGTYFQDYEFVDSISLLDACNGRVGKTPESESEYYYVITDNFPSSPLCFSGTPSTDFRIGGGMGDPGGRSGMGGPPGRPNPEQMMQHMDRNGDGELSRDEVQGPLKDHFDRLDTDKSGTLSRKELKNAKPPGGRP